MKKVFFLLLPFLYLFILLFQIDQSLLEDLGRHIRMGEEIIQCLCVPQTNLFSYTNPNFPVVNHEWLTQAILFFFYKNFGLQSLLILKMVTITLSFAIVYFLAKQKSSGFWLAVVSLLCILIFSSRFRVRPEMFSYLFISLFLLVINLYENGKIKILHFVQNDRVKRGFAKYILLLLPLIQILWVNMHIYFILGIMVYATFLIEKIAIHYLSQRTDETKTKILHFVQNDILKNREFQFLLLIGGLLLFSTLINPQFIKGALLPFTFSSNYGLSVQENMSLFDFGKYAPSFIYTLTLQVVTFEVLVGIFIITLLLVFKRTTIATNLNGLITGILGLRFIRSLSLFGLFGLQPLSEKLTDIEQALLKRTDKYFLNTIKTVVFFSTLFVSFIYVNGLYQNKILQFSFQPYAENATNFINNNHLNGPIFNNYHIGNYLIYGLYPREKIFIDARPEMYPASFLHEYEQMLVDQDFFNTQVTKYHINLIVFGVQLEDPQTIRPFMLRQIKSKEWIPIFADGNVTILIKNEENNQKIIERLRLKI